MTQLETIISHVDKQMERTYDPLIKDIEAIKDDVFGNGKDGLKTRTAVMEKDFESFKDYIKSEVDSIKTYQGKINDKIDSMMWKLALTMGGITVVTQIVFQLLFD